MTPRPDFADALDAVLRREIAGCVGLRGIERLSGGASMETYRLTLETTAGAAGGGTTRSLCLRRGAGGVDRESDYVSGLGVEALAMTAARRAGVAEPEVLYVLAPDDGVGVGFLMEWLDGVTLGARVVRSPELDDVRPQLAYQCGRQLARIHAVDLDSTGLRDVLRHITPADYLEQTWARCRAYPTPQPMIDFTARWLGDNVVSEFEPALVHNDFRNGNLMIDPQRGITAVLDWETVHIGDPMRDLGWVCTNSWRFGRRDLPVGGFGTYDDLFAGYEDESGIRVDPARVRYWEVFGSFWWAVSCLTMAEHYRTGPDPTVERPAIGRRCSECQIDCVNLLIPGEVDLVEGAAEGAVGAAGGEAAGAAGGEMPTLDELLTSVRDFLHGDVMDATTARTNYLARVAANSLDIVRRELTIGPELRRREVAQLEVLLGPGPTADGTPAARAGALRWELVRRLRDGTMPLDEPGLAQYLRDSVVNQVAIDQPGYSGCRHAVGAE